MRSGSQRSRGSGVQPGALGLALLGAGLLLGLAQAQEQATPPASAAVVRGVHVEVTAHTTVNFTELARREAAQPPQRRLKLRVIPFMRGPESFPLPAGAAPTGGEATGTPPQATLTLPGEQPPLLVSPGPTTSFEALVDELTQTPDTLFHLFIPPDTQGTVGPNHLMVTLNSSVRIQNRGGMELSKVSLEGFWVSTGASDVFDPKIIYDPFNDRWVFVALSDSATANSSILLGVTANGDPTGTWNLLRIDADSTDMNWADFPSLGFNKNWIVVSVNMFGNMSNSFVQGEIYAFNKAMLYQATPAASSNKFTDGNAFTNVPALTYDNTLATQYLVQNFNGNNVDGPPCMAGCGVLRISTITGAVGSESYTAQAAFVIQSTTWGTAPSGDFAPQQGDPAPINNGDSRMATVVYRNGSLWAAQNVFLPTSAPDHTAAQWWQLLPDGTVQQLGRVEDNTGTIFYAYPSLAVNSQNDALIGFSTFSANQFAAAGYAFRMAADAAGTMRDPVTLKAGEAKYNETLGGPDNRWGDYSNTVVDPVNDLDFWTIQEYAASPPIQTQSGSHDRWGTWWGKVTITPAAGVVSNTSTITIDDGGSPPTAATPYPSSINVAGLAGTISKLTVRLNGFGHSIPDNVDILLVGPTGAQAILMSDAGGISAVSGLSLTFDDSAAAVIADNGPLASGVFPPVNYTGTGTDTFASPAPSPSGNTLLSTFNGTNPNGSWSLYVVDDEVGSSGTVAGGWTLTIQTSSGAKKRRGQIISE